MWLAQKGLPDRELRNSAYLVNLADTNAGRTGESAVQGESESGRLKGTSRGGGREGRARRPGEGGNAAIENIHGSAQSPQSASIGITGAQKAPEDTSRRQDSPLEHLAR